MKKAGYLLLAVIVVAACAAAGIGYWKFTGNPDALRQIVLQQCLPHQLQQQDPHHALKPDAGYVVFKDRNGPLQYLLMPTWRINGTESPLLLKSGTPNFFWLAWQARSFMSQKYGQEILSKAVSLTINSRSGRTQITCISYLLPANRCQKAAG